MATPPPARSWLTQPWRPHSWLTRVGLAWIPAAILALAPPAGGAPRFTGQQVLGGLRQSVDVVEGHLVFLQAQDRLDDLLAYANWTSRWAPGDVVLAGGQRQGANLGRHQLNLGFGLGSIDGFGVFMGANLDLVGLTGPGLSQIEGLDSNLGGQSLLFLGLAFRGVQLTLASKQSFTDAQALGLDPWGHYRPADGQPQLRPGTPVDLESPLGDDAWLMTALNLYERYTGSFLSVTWADAPGIIETVGADGRVSYGLGPSETRIVDLRYQIQPLRRLPEAVTAWLGVPALGVRRRDPLAALLGDANAADLRTAQALLLERRLPESDPWEIDLGTDDLLGGGLRWRLVQRITPDVRLERAELAWVESFALGEQFLRVAARGLAHQQRGGLELAGEGYALFGMGKADGFAGGLAQWHIGLSYSYNSPDTQTFLPIPDAHVFGLQLAWGDPEAARPLVPLVRAVEARR